MDLSLTAAVAAVDDCDGVDVVMSAEVDLPVRLMLTMRVCARELEVASVRHPVHRPPRHSAVRGTALGCRTVQS